MMKISEVIERLKEIRAEQGDLEVVSWLNDAVELKRITVPIKDVVFGKGTSSNIPVVWLKVF